MTVTLKNCKGGTKIFWQFIEIFMNSESAFFFVSLFLHYYELKSIRLVKKVWHQTCKKICVNQFIDDLDGGEGVSKEFQGNLSTSALIEKRQCGLKE